jgi:hypothetical protein
MIESHTFIEITTPKNGEELQNKTSIKRMRCNYCNATGEILHIDQNDEREFITCPCCNGSRHVDVVVTVKFEPSKFVLMKSKV